MSPWGRRLGIVALVLLLAVAGVLFLTSGDPTSDLEGVAVEDDAGAGADAGPAREPGAPAEDTADDAEDGTDGNAAEDAADRNAAEDAAGDDAGETGPPDAGADIPDGWERYDGATYSVAHPSGWEVREASGPRVDLVDPATGSYLRIDWTDEPKDDPVADWEEQSDAFAARHDDYREIRIEEVDYADRAALWEYAYRDGGAALHAYNLGFVAGDRGYALNLQARADRWDEVEPMFADFMRSFRPAG